MSGLAPVETGQARIPGWVVAVGAAVVFLGVASLAFNLEGSNPDLIGPGPSGAPVSPGQSGPPASPGPGDALAIIERAGCQNCHRPDLAGQGNFPNLHGVADGPTSDNLQQLAADYPDTWIELWINGSGPEVQGLDRGGMPVFGGPGGTLTDQEISTVVEYLLTLE